MRTFHIPPILALSGSHLGNFIRVIRSGRVEWKYSKRLVLSFLFCLVSTPFRWFDSLVLLFGSKPKIEAPVFVVGHWRSGTTFLHHLLCLDPEAAYMTTYQAVFPHNLYTKFIFKNFMRWGIPEIRPGDNVLLRVNDPQEDEFALGNRLYNFHYKFFYFPDQFEKCFEEAVGFSEGSDKEKQWSEAYAKMLEGILHNSSGNQLYVKNPSNSGRIKSILKLFPDARFIRIDRHPIMVYLSSMTFFESIFPATQLQDLDSRAREEMIFRNYHLLMSKMDEDWDIIPKDQRMRVRFEEFEDEPMQTMERIRMKLFSDELDSGFREAIERELQERASYVKNKHHLSLAQFERIKLEMKEQLEKWPEGLPPEIDLS